MNMIYELKGSVQQKLRWVETGVNRWLWAWAHGAGECFIVKVSLHIVSSLFLFLVSTTQFIGEFWHNRWSGMSYLAQILLALHSKQSYYYWRCDAPCTYRRSCAHLPRLSAKQGAFAAPKRRFLRIFQIPRASPISGVQIAAPLVLAQYKGNKRIVKVQTPVHRASPIVIELAY
jgi:hypothetical protein